MARKHFRQYCPEFPTYIFSHHPYSWNSPKYIEDPKNFLIILLFLISNVLTQFMSNTASAALLAPIGISIAQTIGCDPKPVLMALGIAASMAFATPMATPPNTLVLGPGNFTFNDYVKVGVPLCLISWVACVIIIPIFWPFH